MQIPSYIVKNYNGIYYFRYVIPKKDRHLFPNNRNEFRRSLKTRSRTEALRLARFYWVQLMTSEPKSLENKITEQESQLRRGQEIFLELNAFELSYNDINSANYKNSDDRSEFLANLSLSDIQCLNLINEDIRNNNNPTHYPPDTANVNKTSLPTAFERYLQTKGNIENKTLNGYRKHLKLFIKITKITNVKNVEKIEFIREYQDKIQRLPAGITQSKDYIGKSIDDILAMNPKPMAHKTINSNISSIKSFLKWLSDQQYINSDVSGILNSIKNSNKTKDSEHRAAFTLSDLNQMFSTPEYQKNGFKKVSARYWLPLLALFTGARINELCQLGIDDIYEKDNIYVIDINNKRDKKVKTKSAIRIIPVHNTLIKLGFIDYFDAIKRTKATKLFPTLKPDKNRDCARTISRFFNEKYKSSNGFSDYCGIKKNSQEGKKVFHSFRHTFINQWKQQQLNSNMVKQLAGHASSDITFDIYGKSFPVSKLSEELNKIDFGLSKSPRKWHKSYY